MGHFLWRTVSHNQRVKQFTNQRLVPSAFSWDCPNPNHDDFFGRTGRTGRGRYENLTVCELENGPFIVDLSPEGGAFQQLC